MPTEDDDYDEALTRDFREDRRLVWWGIALAAGAALLPILALPAVVVAVVAIVRGHIALGAVIIVGAGIAAASGLERNAEARAPSIPAVPVEVHYGACPDISHATGCYYPHSNQMWVTEEGDSFSYWHEMGHAFDAQRLDDGERHRFACLPASKPQIWGDPDICDAPWGEYAVEVFAEAYANCKQRLRFGSRDFMRDYGYEPTTARRHRNACRLIARAAD